MRTALLRSPSPWYRRNALIVGSLIEAWGVDPITVLTKPLGPDLIAIFIATQPTGRR